MRHRPGRVRGAALASLLLLAACAGGHPPDEELLARFAERRQSFERLLALSRSQPRLQRITHDWCADREGNRYFGPTPGVLSVESWGEYRTLFYELGIKDGIEIADGALWLIASRSGRGTSATTKGYLHREREEKARLCDTLDVENAVGCRRPLEDGWYLFVR